MPHCLLCGATKLCDAHIVPRALYPKVKDLRAYDTILPYSVRRPKGAYDKNILCAECDGKIGLYDDYAAKLLLPWPSKSDYVKRADGFIMRHEDRRPIGYWLKSPNIKLMMGFAASLLWRAGVTSLPEMRLEVDVTTLERAKRIFWHNDMSNCFGVMALRLEPRYSIFVSAPIKHDEEEHFRYQFCMSGLVLNIAVRPVVAEDEAEYCILGVHRNWLVGFAPYQGSTYAHVMQEIMKVKTRR